MIFLRVKTQLIMKEGFRIQLLLILILCNYSVIAQEKRTLSIPTDTSIFLLTEKVLLETAELKLEIEQGSYLLSEAKNARYKGFERTLVRVRDRLIGQSNKITELKNEITTLQNSLREIANITDVALLEDIENLSQIKKDLEIAQTELSQSNSELVNVKADLEKTTKKLERQKKGGNIIKGIIGAAGIAIGVIIGSAF